MANTAVVASRRDDIGQRWLRGQSVASIARELDTPLGTVKHDLHYIRQELLSGQGDVLRIVRARTMAATEMVIAEAWTHVDLLKRRRQDYEGTIATYLGLILRAHAQLAKLAGLPTQATTYLERGIFSRDLADWVKTHDPDEIRFNAQMSALLGGGEDDSDEDEEDDESESENTAALLRQLRGITAGRSTVEELVAAAIAVARTTVPAAPLPSETPHTAETPEPVLEANPAASEPDPPPPVIPRAVPIPPSMATQRSTVSAARHTPRPAAPRPAASQTPAAPRHPAAWSDSVDPIVDSDDDDATDNYEARRQHYMFMTQGRR